MFHSCHLLDTLFSLTKSCCRTAQCDAVFSTSIAVTCVESLFAFFLTSTEYSTNIFKELSAVTDFFPE